MTAQKPLFRPKFTPIPPHVDIPALVNSSPNFQWAHREDSRLHAAPYHQLNRIVGAVTLEQGLPIVVDNWHLRGDWNAAVFSHEWLERQYGDEVMMVRELRAGDARDIPMSWSSFLHQIPDLSAQDFSEVRGEGRDRGPRRVYGKDLDCPEEWCQALASVLPPEICYMGVNDLMAKLPPSGRALNQMIYVGHEGTYTPAHRDQCATFGQNIMVHTTASPTGVEGLSYWFIFSARDRKRVADYWNTLGYNIDTEDLFASIEDLKAFPGTVYVVEQRVGDFIIVPPLATHQVYNHGGMTVKAAWNRTTVDTLELAIGETLPAYRFTCREEMYKNKAIVHQSLLDLSRYQPHHLLSSPARADVFMRLFRLYNHLLIDEFIPPDYFYTQRPNMEKIPQEFNVQCSFCHTNIWNRFLTCRACVQTDADGDPDTYDICMECFARGRSCRDITGLEWVQQEKWSELMSLWERCRGIYQFLGGEDIDDFNAETSIKVCRKTLAGVCVEELMRRPSPRGTTPLPPEGLCHTCKVRHPTWKMVFCTREGCHRAYCFGNLFRQFDEDPFDVLAKTEGYTCPYCRGVCNCGACRKRKDQIGYEPRLRVGGTNAKFNQDPRSVESLVSSGHTNMRWHLETKGTLTMKSERGTDRESTGYDNGSMVYETSSPDVPKLSFPEQTKVSFAGTSNLDPAILDPEMSNYFLGTHTHDPPPYTELDADDFLDHSMLDHGDTGWSHFDHAYDAAYDESFIAQPLSTAGVIDPTLFTSQISGRQEFPDIFSGSVTPTQSEQLSLGIAPILLSKTPSVEVPRETVKAVEKPLRVSGKAKEITGEIHKQLARPPKRNSVPSGVSPKENPPATAKRRGRPAKSLSALPPSAPPSQEPTASRKPVPSDVDDTFKVTETADKRRHEVIVATGLDTVKRIRLVFHEDLTPPLASSPPVDLNSPRTTRSGKRDVVLRPRRTSPLAMLDDDLSGDFDDGTSPPAKRRKFISGVAVPWRRIDTSLYGVFLSGRARQTMVTSKRDGTFKGIKFEW